MRFEQSDLAKLLRCVDPGIKATFDNKHVAVVCPCKDTYETLMLFVPKIEEWGFELTIGTCNPERPTPPEQQALDPAFWENEPWAKKLLGEASQEEE